MPDHKIPHPFNILESFKPMKMTIKGEKYLFAHCSYRIYIYIYIYMCVCVCVFEFFLVNIVAYVMIYFSNKFVNWYYLGLTDRNIAVPTLAIWKRKTIYKIPFTK